MLSKKMPSPQNASKKPAASENCAPKLARPTRPKTAPPNRPARRVRKLRPQTGPPACPKTAPPNSPARPGRKLRPQTGPPAPAENCAPKPVRSPWRKVRCYGCSRAGGRAGTARARTKTGFAGNKTNTMPNNPLSAHHVPLRGLVCSANVASCGCPKLRVV